MTNILLTLLLTNRIACISFDAQPFTFYRLERTLVLPATNWLAADYHEGTPYHMPVVLCDAGRWDAVTYRVVGFAL